MKNSTKTLFATLAVVFLACAAFGPQAQAVMISGGISLAGSYRTDTGDINTANAFTGFKNTIVADTSGDYAAVPDNTAVTMNIFTFDPFVGPISPLWTFMSGGLTYSFDLASCTIVQQGFNTLTLVGSGDLNITGFDTTAGSWVFTANQAGGTFSFSSSNAAVPEGGSALILLGFGLIGLEALRRKLAIA